MIRVLHIFHEMSNGGIEHFVMDYYRHIDREKVQFDFLVSVDEEGDFDDEIRLLGGKIHRAYPLKKNPIKNYLDIARIVKENSYDIVHRHTGSAFAKYDLLAAKHGGAEHLILHSHNNQAGNNILHYISNMIFHIDCEKLACSREAGEWLFGKKSDFEIISNAIECERFKYNEDERKKIRAELGIENKFVVGHVGRFEVQKNHHQMLKIFKDLLSQRPDSVLICIGDGSLHDEIVEEAKNLDIYKFIKFLGNRSDISSLMQGFDCFILPSLYEGFPFVLVEAQTSGLHCIVSNCVPKECDITGNIDFVSLDSSSNMSWIKTILNESKNTLKREKYFQIMKDNGFDINENAKKLCKYYQNLMIGE